MSEAGQPPVDDRIRVLLLFPGLGIGYACLFLLAELPLFSWLGLRFGELASLSRGKSFGNLAEIPLMFALGALAAFLLQRGLRARSRSWQTWYVVLWYAGAAATYLAFPTLPE